MRRLVSGRLLPTELLKSKVNNDHLVFGTNFAGWDQQDYNVREEAAPFANNARTLLRAS